MENQQEIEKEQITISKSEEETQQKPEIKRDTEPAIKPRVLTHTLIENASPTLLRVQELLWLKDQPFTIESILDTKLVLMLLGKYGLYNVIEKAEDRYLKWYSKRGKELSENAQAKHREFAHRTALLETVIGSALDHLGISGGQRGEYLSYTKHIMSRIRKRQLNAWLKEAEEAYQTWKRREHLKSEWLRILAHLTLKTHHYFLEKTRLKP